MFPLTGEGGYMYKKEMGWKNNERPHLLSVQDPLIEDSDIVRQPEEDPVLPLCHIRTDVEYLGPKTLPRRVKRSKLSPRKTSHLYNDHVGPNI